MTNREWQFVMSLRDNFTAGWQKAVGNAQASLARMRQQLGQVQGWIAGAFSVAAIRNFMTAFQEQEKASARLQQALRNAGVTSQQAQKDMEAFSSQIQKATVYGDELVTNVQAMLVAMTGLAGDAIKPLTVAALDLASGLKINAETAAGLIAKTIEGRDALSRYGISVKGAATESEKLALITDQIREKFGGFAEREAQTAEGRTKQMQNAVGDLQEKFGELILRGLSPFVPLLQKAVEALEKAPPFVHAMVLATGALTVAFYALNIPMGGIPLLVGAIIVGFVGLAAIIADNAQKIQEFAKSLLGFHQGLNGVALRLFAITSILGAFSGSAEKAQAEMGKMTSSLQMHMNAVESVDYGQITDDVDLLRKKISDLQDQLLRTPQGTEEWAKLGKQIEQAYAALDKALPPVAGSLDAMQANLRKLEAEFKKVPAHSEKWNKLVVDIRKAQEELEKVQAAAALVGRDTSVIKIAVEATVSKLKLDENLRLPTNLPTVEIPAVITIDEQLEDAARVAPLLHNQMRRMADQQALIAKYGQEWYNKLIEAERQFEVLSAASMALTDTLRANFSQAWDDIFGEANSLLEQFGRRFLQILMDDVLARFERSLLDRIAGGASGGGGGGGLGIGALAGAIHPALALLGFLFHKGGTVPKAHSGAYVDPNGALKGLSLSNIPSNKEFPIIVRGGETIRTEMQERHLQQMIQQAQSIINSANRPPAGVSLPPSYPTSPAVASPVGTSNTTTNRTEVTINISGPVVGRAEWVIESIQEAVRRSGLPVDRLAVNTRGKRQL